MRSRDLHSALQASCSDASFDHDVVPIIIDSPYVLDMVLSTAGYEYVRKCRPDLIAKLLRAEFVERGSAELGSIARSTILHPALCAAIRLLTGLQAIKPDASIAPNSERHSTPFINLAAYFIGPLSAHEWIQMKADLVSPEIVLTTPDLLKPYYGHVKRLMHAA